MKLAACVMGLSKVGDGGGGAFIGNLLGCHSCLSYYSYCELSVELCAISY